MTELLPYCWDVRAKEVMFDTRILMSASSKVRVYTRSRSMSVAWNGHGESGLEPWMLPGGCLSINGYEVPTAEE